MQDEPSEQELERQFEMDEEGEGDRSGGGLIALSDPHCLTSCCLLVALATVWVVAGVCWLLR